MGGYTPIMEEYKKELDKKVKAGKLKQRTIDEYIRIANRIFESLIGGISKETLESFVEVKGFKGDYWQTIIKPLKEIASNRKRK